MNKKIIFYGLSLAIFLAFIFFTKGYETSETSYPTTFSSASSSVSFATSTKVSHFDNKEQINFIVGANNYPVNAPVGSTAYDAMNILASTTDFTFKSVFYSGLGYFIEEINNVKNSHGQYWTLYVNGKYSDVGVSDYKLSQGDVIEWKYEK